MRIWDISPNKLCNKHLLGEHSELHAIWSVITNDKKGFANHPETLRWKGKLKALYLRHEQQIKEMENRGFNHNSPLDINFAIGCSVQKDFVDSLQDQIKILKIKKCECIV
jgi:hypothetical protein